MPLLTFGMAWVGYAIFVWGFATVRGCNVSFSDVAIPGRFSGCHPDQGAKVNTGFAPGTTPSTPIPIGGGRTTPASNLPGRPGSEVSP